MKIFMVIIALISGSQTYDANSSVDLNTITVCAALNNVYRTFSNIWEIYSEFKATGQLWMPVAINACPVSYVDCPTYTPVCAVSSDNVYKTFTNKCVLEAEQKANAIAWKIVFNGACSDNSGDGFLPAKSLGLSTTDNHNQASLASHSSSSYHADNHSLAKYKVPLQTFTNREINGNIFQYPETSTNSTTSSDSNQVVVRAQSEQSSLSSHSSSSYSEQQQQPLPSYPEPVQPFANTQVDQNAKQLPESFSSSQISGRLNQVAAQAQIGETFMPSHSPSSYNGSSAPSEGLYNSVQQQHISPSYLELIHSIANGHVPQNSLHLSPSSVISDNSNLVTGQAHIEQASLSSLPHPLLNYPVPTHPPANVQVHQNSAKLPSGFRISGGPNEVLSQSQTAQASLSTHLQSYYNNHSTPSEGEHNSVPHLPLPYNAKPISPFPNNQLSQNLVQLPASSLAATLQQPQNLSNYSESMQPFANSHAHHNSVQISSSSPSSVSLKQVSAQAHTEQSLLLSHSSSDYNGPSVPSEGPPVKVLPTYFEPIQPFANGQLHQNSAPLANSILRSKFSRNGNQVKIQAQGEKSSSESSAQPISAPISINNDVPNSYSQCDLKPCAQSKGAGATPSGTDESVADTETYRNDKTDKSPELEDHHLLTNSQISNSKTPNSYNSKHQYSNTSSEESYNYLTATPSAENVNKNPQNEGQTIYNGVVYQGPYYYEPNYKHIYFGSFKFAPAPEPVTNKESTLPTANSNAAPFVAQQYKTDIRPRRIK